MNTIDLQPTSERRRDSYGLLLESPTYHDVVGTRHNPHHRHTVQVWEERDENREPTGEYRFVTAAQPTVIAAHPDASMRPPFGQAIVVGETVRLTVNGYPLGEFVVRHRRLADPVLDKL